MSTRWIVDNALRRGTVTTPHGDPFYPVANLYDELPLRPARFTQTGQNDVLLDANLSLVSPFTVHAGEPLRFVSGVALNIQNALTRDFLQPGATWAPGASAVTAPFDFVVQDYARMQKETAQLIVTLGSAVIVPIVDALTLHGHSALWQLTTAAQWHSGAAPNPTGLQAQALPLAHTQLFVPAAPVSDRYHRFSFFGDQPLLGSLVLGALRSSPYCFGQGRIITYRWPQDRLTIPAGLVGSYSWVFKDTRAWQGDIRSLNGTLSVFLETLWRASSGGSSPLVFIPEDGVVMYGWLAQTFSPRALAADSFEIAVQFDEAPLPLAA